MLSGAIYGTGCLLYISNDDEIQYLSTENDDFRMDTMTITPKGRFMENYCYGE